MKAISPQHTMLRKVWAYANLRCLHTLSKGVIVGSDEILNLLVCASNLSLILCLLPWLGPEENNYPNIFLKFIKLEGCHSANMSTLSPLFGILAKRY